MACRAGGPVADSLRSTRPTGECLVTAGERRQHDQTGGDCCEHPPGQRNPANCLCGMSRPAHPAVGSRPRLLKRIRRRVDAEDALEVGVGPRIGGVERGGRRRRAISARC